MNRIKISEHFYLNEFECPCCHRVMIDERLLEALEKLRNLWGKAIVITSGYRCQKHNQAIGGVRGSQHTLGKAADILVKPHEMVKVMNLARECGFKGIGMYAEKGFIHLDVRGTRQTVVWGGGGSARPC